MNISLIVQFHSIFSDIRLKSVRYLPAVLYLKWKYLRYVLWHLSLLQILKKPPTLNLQDDFRVQIQVKNCFENFRDCMACCKKEWIFPIVYFLSCSQVSMAIKTKSQLARTLLKRFVLSFTSFGWRKYCFLFLSSVNLKGKVLIRSRNRSYVFNACCYMCREKK